MIKQPQAFHQVEVELAQRPMAQEVPHLLCIVFTHRKVEAEVLLWALILRKG